MKQNIIINYTKCALDNTKKIWYNKIKIRDKGELNKMARFPYTKLNAKINQEVKEIRAEGSDTPIEVRQYLPVEEKLALIGRVIELAHDENNFSNPLKVEVYYTLEVIKAYTNISFTDKQWENPTKLYDSLLSSGWINKIFYEIPEFERDDLRTSLNDTIAAFYAYRNSVMGVLDNIQTDYSDMNLDIAELQQKLANGENIELVKNILGKLG